MCSLYSSLTFFGTDSHVLFGETHRVIARALDARSGVRNFGLVVLQKMVRGEPPSGRALCAIHPNPTDRPTTTPISFCIYEYYDVLSVCVTRDLVETMRSLNLSYRCWLLDTCDSENSGHARVSAHVMIDMTTCL